VIFQKLEDAAAVAKSREGEPRFGSKIMTKKNKSKKMVWGASGTISNICPKVPGNFGTTKSTKQSKSKKGKK